MKYTTLILFNREFTREIAMEILGDLYVESTNDSFPPGFIGTEAVKTILAIAGVKFTSLKISQ